jgi:hypothetical protein
MESSYLMHGIADGTAVDYVMAGVLLGNNCSPDDCRLVGPTFMCFSFAIELNLKSILVHLKIDPGMVHPIKALFNLLPDHKKEWLHMRFEDHSGGISMGDFKSEIEKWSDTFVQVRYCHDLSRKDEAFFDFSDFVPNLSISLHNSFAVNEKQERLSLMSKVGISANKKIKSDGKKPPRLI